MSNKNQETLIIEVYKKDIENREYLLCRYNERTRALCNFIAISGAKDKVIINVIPAIIFLNEGKDIDLINKDEVVFIKNIFDKMISTNNFDFVSTDKFEFYNNGFESYHDYKIDKAIFI